MLPREAIEPPPGERCGARLRWERGRHRASRRARGHKGVSENGEETPNPYKPRNVPPIVAIPKLEGKHATRKVCVLGG